MKNNQSKQLHDKLQKLYFEYLTEYLIFSEEYETLNENKLLDSEIKAGYIYHLYSSIEDIKESNVYPSRIIDNYLHFLSILEQRTKEILSEEELKSMEPLFIEMYENLLSIRDLDDHEIYYLEYIKRYSNMKDLDKVKGILVKQLEVDIQVDYLYLSVLMTGNIDGIKYIQSDFKYFLQKLLIDLPEIVCFPKIKDMILKTIHKMNDPELNKYLLLVEEPCTYNNNIGFNIDTMELLYGSTLLQKMIFTGKTKEILSSIDPNVIFTTSMFNNLCNALALYINKGYINVKEKEAYQEIIYFMREHMDCCSAIYKKEYVDLINHFIGFFNTCKVTDYTMPMYRSALTKSKDYKKIDNYFYSKDKKEFELKADVQMELVHDLMECFFGKNNIEELKEDGKYTISALTYLFSEYPRMFFESTIYQKAMEIINSIPCKKASVLKKQIRRMRRK